MLFGDVNLPNDLIEAHRAGELVLFVGAGASRSAPSNLPSFRELADQIARGSGLDGVPVEYHNRLDAFLGYLKAGPPPVDVHDRVVQIVGEPQSSPNTVHQAVVRLAQAGGAVRIVTTNYDRHLTAALDRSDLPEYVAPALPLGHDFEGIIYLHGKISVSRPSQLVVTDKDFGSAYLTEAWAARFLERMFRKFSVLFIGYSHNDIVMTYLARGLTESSPRYALVTSPAEGRWRTIDIEPIEYPNEDGQHIVLPNTLRRWAERSEMDLLDHSVRVRGLIQNGILPQVPEDRIMPLVPEDESYLKWIMENPTTVNFFTSEARGARWLHWVAQQPTFDELFDNCSETEVGNNLAIWFAREYAADPNLVDLALSIASGRSTPMSLTLWQAVCSQLHEALDECWGIVRRWVPLLVAHRPRSDGSNHDLLGSVLGRCVWPDDRDIALILFDFLTRPSIRQDTIRPVKSTGQVCFKIELSCNLPRLRKAWSELLQPNLDELLATEIVELLFHQVRTTYRLLRTLEASPEWEFSIFHRLTIAGGTKKSTEDPLGFLLDTLRDVCEWLTQNNPNAMAMYIERWAQSDMGLLVKLAIHLQTARDDLTSDEKAKWLLEVLQERMFRLLFRPEVFTALGASLPDVSAGLVDDLVELVEQEEFGLENLKVIDRVRFEFLSWINQHVPEIESAATALAPLKAKYPDWVPSDCPALPYRIETGTLDPQLPMTPEEFHTLLGEDPGRALEGLLGLLDQGDVMPGPSWEDALTLVCIAAERNVEDGLAVLGVADLDGSLGKIDLVSSVIRGWGEAPWEGQEDWIRVMNRLTGLASDQGYVKEIGRFLVQRTRPPTNPHQAEHNSVMRTIAKRAWESMVDDDSYDASTDWLQRAIDSPAGDLALFWVSSISMEWQEAGDQWTGLSESTREAMMPMLAGGAPEAFAQVVLASQLHFLHRADPHWATEHILPLLNWSENAERAERCWDGFLTWGLITEPLLRLGLWDFYRETLSRSKSWEEDRLDMLCRHLAGLLVTFDPMPDIQEFLRDLTCKLKPKTLVRWMDEVAWLMEDTPSAVADARWNDWIRDYWTGRTNSVPSSLTEEEASAIAVWAALIPSATSEAVTLAARIPAKLSEYSSLLRENVGGRVAQREPLQYVKLVAHLLKSCDRPFHEADDLRAIVQQHLCRSLSGEDLRPLLEQATRLGSADASQWCV